MQLKKAQVASTHGGRPPLHEAVPTSFGTRCGRKCVAFFEGATGKGRNPQSFGDGETGRAHAIPNVQELATRGKARVSPVALSRPRNVKCSSFEIN
jgi:hypothetical protein